MQKTFTSILHSAIFSFLVILAMPTKAKAQCNALFTYEQIQNTLTIHFINQSTSEHEIISNAWNFGDGHTGDGQNPNHTYAEAGSYEVCLTIHDNFGCVDSFCLLVVVEPVGQGGCNALFEYEQIQNTLTIHFINQSTSEHDIISYSWNFGDGHTGDGQNPNHTYGEAGSYEVCLTIHDNVGCEDTYCHLVIVVPLSQGCNALFEYEQIQNTLTIHFINQSTSEHDIISYSWNFGDGHTGDGQNPNHTYSEAGSYEVCLTIHDNVGCEDTYCHLVVVLPIEQGDCNALFEYEQIQNTLTIHFINQSTSSHNITSYLWNFGDGHNGDGENPNHTYSEAGSYEVCLTIHDDIGCVDTYCHLVIVEPVNQGGCNALFEYEQIPNTLTIHFINQSTSEHDIISYSWNFGDGHTGDGQNPYHTYGESGSYEVCLTIHDNVGCVDSFCLLVVVEPVNQGACNALFVYEQIQGTLTIHFNNQSTSEHDIISYSWNFGDGHTGDGQNPNHTYGEPGSYEVCLTIHDNVGCEDTYCLLVIVEPVSQGECEADFGYYQGDSTLTIYFIDSSYSQYNITSWSWNFGDGHTGDGQNPHHTYLEAGTYEVCLTIHGDCTDTYCQVVVVEPVSQGECNALFEYQQLENSLTVHFTDLSSSSHDIVSWFWTFGDGGVSDNHAPNHTYDHAGTYEVCLIIHDNTGCSDTICLAVIVEPVSQGECEAYFDYYQLQNSLTIQFVDSSFSQYDITSYSWNFGDGHTGDGQNPHHTYEHSGTYEVCLTIHDNHDCTDTYCHVVHVEPIGQGECNALFEYQQIENTFTIHFTDLSTSNHDIVSWSWNFGDGHNGDGQNPNHTYDHAGTYEVCLTIHDNNDCTDIYCHVVHVVEDMNACHASFEADVDSTGLTVYFTNTSTNTTEHTTYLWTFGDGTSSTEENPIHTYEEEDNYNVCLIITDTTTNCSSDYCHIVHVHPQGGSHQAGLFTANNNGGQEKAEWDQVSSHFVTIFPNPFSTTTYVQYELEKEMEVRIEMNDLFGNQIRQISNTLEQKGTHTQQVDAGYLNPGIYLIKMTIGNELMIRKIIITQ